ncbi:MAG: hypothetical protein H8E42_09755 [Nitrospinae bacterium]|nr:hypothetical protein [Nitrospinota bacterium]MBL7019283.1 hypothetical protein [Nitrospinaceae bacterium]
MHLFKEENVQTTYPKRQPAKPVSRYILPITLLAVMVFLINTLHGVTLPDPLGEKIQQHIKTQKPNKKG